MKRGTSEENVNGNIAASCANSEKKKGPSPRSSPQSISDRTETKSLAQKRDVIDTSTSSSSSSSLWDAPTAIIVHIFDYLDNDALMKVCTVSKQSLDIVRNGPIQNKFIPVFEISAASRETPNAWRTLRLFQKLLQLYQNDDTKRKFQQYCCIVLKNIQTFDGGNHCGRMVIAGKMELGWVTSLNISCPSRVSKVSPHLSYALSYILPNLIELDLSNIGGDGFDRVIRNFVRECPSLEKITWNGIDADSSIYVTGFDLKKARNLKEIFTDDSYFYVNDDDADHFQNLNSHPESFIFHHCNKNVEKVSIRYARWYTGVSHEFIPQSALIKFIRNAPSSLRYFASDLTRENIDMLKFERPEIDFVN